VDELLDVTRVSRGKIRLDRQPLDLAGLLRSAAGDHQAALEEAGLTLRLELPEGPVPVAGDPVRLTQVVGNLLHNATKFTERGGRVTVELSLDREARRAAVAVRDSGIGIEP